MVRDKKKKKNRRPNKRGLNRKKNRAKAFSDVYLRHARTIIAEYRAIILFILLFSTLTSTLRLNSPLLYHSIS